MIANKIASFLTYTKKVSISCDKFLLEMIFFVENIYSLFTDVHCVISRQDAQWTSWAAGDP